MKKKWRIVVDPASESTKFLFKDEGTKPKAYGAGFRSRTHEWKSLVFVGGASLVVKLKMKKDNSKNYDRSKLSV